MRIEATYLVRELPKDTTEKRFEKIEQGYLTDSPDAVRVRKRGDEFSLTHKSIPIPGDLSYREYANVHISKEEFKKIFDITIKQLRKKRYYYMAGDEGMELRIDVFEGNLTGLVLAEVVFPDEDLKRDFSLPSWLGREITSEKWASNQYLASKNFSQIKQLIA